MAGIVPAGYGFMDSVRLTAYVEELRDVRELPQELVFLRRTPVVPAEDNEIMGSFVGNVQIADLVSDGGEAVTYDTGKMQFHTYDVPNIKHGVNITAQQLREMYNMQLAGLQIAGRRQSLTTMQENNAEMLLLGTEQRMEAMIVGMWQDGFSYDRLGVKIKNATWGMPADLKVVVTGNNRWDQPATAKPLTQIRSLRKTARIRYNTEFNRITMTQTAFDYMCDTQEFKDKAATFLAPNIAFSTLDVSDNNVMMPFAKRALGIDVIELYDSRYWSTKDNGDMSSYPYLATPMVLLSSTSNDGQRGVMDWGNGIVNEGLLSAFGGGNVIGNIPPYARGPIAYNTFPADANPVRATQWSSARGWPRKRIRQATACILTGDYEDLTPVGPVY